MCIDELSTLISLRSTVMRVRWLRPTESDELCSDASGMLANRKQAVKLKPASHRARRIIAVYIHTGALELR